MNFTGPLSKDYCALFMYTSLICLVFCGICMIRVVYLLISSVGGKNYNYDAVISTALVIPSYLFLYISYRLLYNMCLR